MGLMGFEAGVLSHAQELGCYTDCHNNTFCSNDPYSVNCYTVTNANHCWWNAGCGGFEVEGVSC
jgi:hypothetical protein